MVNLETPHTVDILPVRVGDPGGERVISVPMFYFPGFNFYITKVGIFC